MSRVLVVDDSKLIRQVLRTALRGLGADVLVASESEEALSLAVESRFDAVLTDISMPGSDGFELTRALRAMPGYRHCPIFILTVRETQAQVRAGEAAGVTGWIRKPFDHRTLLDTVRQALIAPAIAA